MPPITKSIKTTKTSTATTTAETTKLFGPQEIERLNGTARLTQLLLRQLLKNNSRKPIQRKEADDEKEQVPFSKEDTNNSLHNNDKQIIDQSLVREFENMKTDLAQKLSVLL